MNNDNNTIGLRRYRDYALPALGIIETIATEGKSPGVTAAAQQKVIDARLNERAQDIKDEEDRFYKRNEQRDLAEQRALQNRLAKYKLDKEIITDEKDIVQKQKNALSDDEAIGIAMEQVANLGQKDEDFINNGYKARMEIAIAKKDIPGAMEVLSDYTKNKKDANNLKQVKYGLQLSIGGKELQNKIRQTIQKMRDVGYSSTAMDLIDSQNEADPRLSTSLAEKLTNELMKSEAAKFVKIAGIKGEAEMLPTVADIATAKATASKIGQSPEKTGVMSDSATKTMSYAGGIVTDGTRILNYLNSPNAQQVDFIRKLNSVTNPSLKLALLNVADLRGRINSGAAVTSDEERRYLKLTSDPAAVLGKNWKEILRQRMVDVVNIGRGIGNVVWGGSGWTKPEMGFVSTDLHLPGEGPKRRRSRTDVTDPDIITPANIITEQQYNMARKAMSNPQPTNINGKSLTADQVREQANKIILMYESQRRR